MTRRFPARSYRLPGRTLEQIDWLQQHGYQTATQVVIVAIDRMYTQEATMTDEYGFDTRLLALAEAIHTEVCGCDSKRCSLVSEIYDWLTDGDTDDMSVDDLVAEWREYTAAAEDADA